MSGNDDCLNEEIISLGGTRSRGTVEYEEYWDEDGQEDHLVQCSRAGSDLVDEHYVLMSLCFFSFSCAFAFDFGFVDFGFAFVDFGFPTLIR